MKSRIDGEVVEYSAKTTNFGVILELEFKSALYKLYDLGQVIFLSFSLSIYKIKYLS